MWRRVSREVKQTRDFFEQQREMEAMEGGGWTWPEGNDPISLMERAVNIKVTWPYNDITLFPLLYYISPSLPPSLPPSFLSPTDIQLCWCAWSGVEWAGVSLMEGYH